MIRKIFNQEEGIALTIAVFVMIVLLGIAGAMFISTQNESTNSLANTAKMNSLMVSNSGAERSIWYLQQKCDNTPDWDVQNQNLFTEEKPTVDCKNLIKERDPEIYKKYGLCLKPRGNDKEGYSYLYASELRHEDDLLTPEDEWAIYTVGVTRTPSNSRLSSREISVIKVLVKLGIGTSPFPDVDIVSGSDDIRDRWHENTRFRLFNPDKEVKIVIPDGLDYLAGSKPNPLWGYEWRKEPGDGILTEIDNKTQQVVFYSNEKIDNKLISIKGVSISNKEINFPEMDLAIYKDMADYTAEYLTDEGVLKKQGDAYYLLKDIVIDNKGVEDLNIPQSLPYPGTYSRLVDRNKNDGLVIIYVPDGSLILQPQAQQNRKLVVGPDSHGMIVTRGKSDNLRKPVENSLDPLVPDTGFQSFELYYDPTPYEFTRGTAFPTPMWWEQLLLADIGKDANNDISYIYQGKREYKNLMSDPMKDEPLIGTLDILSDYDIILSSPITTQCKASRFRGFIYSKGHIHLRTDLIQKGCMMAGKGINWYDQGKLFYVYMVGKDGFDWVFYSESPVGRRDSQGEISFPYRIIGGEGTGPRKFEVIAISDVSNVSKNIF
ncbi:MAG: hypothetical protein QME42_11510 [bacterium]|nr:hypothetical protein [bacterium]